MTVSLGSIAAPPPLSKVAICPELRTGVGKHAPYRPLIVSSVGGGSKDRGIGDQFGDSRLSARLNGADPCTIYLYPYL